MKHLDKFKKVHILIMLILVLALFVGGINWFASRQRIPDGYVLVEQYTNAELGGVTCAAALPVCGDCSVGKVVHGKCYVPKEFSPYEGL